MKSRLGWLVGWLAGCWGGFLGRLSVVQRCLRKVLYGVLYRIVLENTILSIKKKREHRFSKNTKDPNCYGGANTCQNQKKQQQNLFWLGCSFKAKEGLDLIYKWKLSPVLNTPFVVEAPLKRGCVFLHFTDF